AIGLVPKVCKVRRPETKGKVERGVHYVKYNFLPGKRFVDLQDLNQQALFWCDKINRRIHGTTGERPTDRLRKEDLSPIPSFDRWEKYLYEPRQVSRDGFVSYDGVRYGVPWRHSGREVTVREVNGWVEIWADGTCISRHQKVYRSRATVFCENQYAGLTTAQGYAYPRPQAQQISSQQVEVRSLDVYEQLTGVGA
ncbi:transposase, partial [Anoxybacillus rupiensis]|nr:transposase [Brevibacillus sp. NL20B1]MBS2773234.1 transposase [Anoxybacillus rupiensis]